MRFGIRRCFPVPAWMAIFHGFAVGCSGEGKSSGEEVAVVACLERTPPSNTLPDTVHFQGGTLVPRASAGIEPGEPGEAHVRLKESSGDCLILRMDVLSRHDRLGDTVDSRLLALSTKGGSFGEWLQGRADVRAEVIYLRHYEEPPTLRSLGEAKRLDSWDFYGDPVVICEFEAGGEGGFEWSEGKYRLALRWIRRDVGCRPKVLR